MRRGVWSFALGVLLAAIGAASAYAAGATTATTTTTSTTTTSTTTTTATTAATTTAATTTTPAPPSYSTLTASHLATGCVGAGAAAIAEPGRAVLTLGTPASSRGPSTYPAKAPIVRFLSSSGSGTSCTAAHVSLESVVLFGGVITARSIEATHGRGAVSGVKIYGSQVALSPGHAVRVGGWGEVTLAKTVGRLTAPLVVQLLAPHRALPAGTTIALAFAASPQAVHKSTSTKKQAVSGTKQKSGSAKQTGHAKKKSRRHTAKVAQPLTATPGLGYKPSHYVFPVDGGASYVDTYGAGRSDIYDGWHHGDDLFAPLGTPVVAVARGTLSLVGWNRLGGWRLWLTDKKGNSFYYAHLAGYARWILTQHHVRAGQVIGFLGRTGDAFTTEPHLHFEIHPHEPYYVKLGYDGAVDPTRYLHVWKMEHLPARVIPQPAKLRAPVGTPRQEAAVVWRQLLVARHLVPTKSAASVPPQVGQALPHSLRLATGVLPQPLGGVLRTSERVSASETNFPLLVGGPLGGALALSGAVGAFFFRRRRRLAAAAAVEPS